MHKADIALIISGLSFLVSFGVLYLHFKRYRSETKPHLRVNLVRERDQFIVKAVNPSKGPVVVEKFGFQVAKKQFSINIARFAGDVPTVKLEQNDTHSERIGTREISAILEEELGIKGLQSFRGLYIDSHENVWRGTQTLEINTEEWWPPEDGRTQQDSYGSLRWRNINIIKS